MTDSTFVHQIRMDEMQSFLPLAEAPKARTQLFDLSEPVECMLEKLLQPKESNELGIDILLLPFARKGRDWPEYMKQVHKTIRKAIGSALNTTVKTNFQYHTLRIRENFLVVYLSPKPDVTPSKLQEFKAKGFDLYRLVQAVLELHLKRRLIKEAADNFELGIVDYNSELFFAAEVQSDKANKRGHFYIDALIFELYFSPDFNDLTFELHGKCFQSKTPGVGLVSGEDRLLLANKETQQILDKVSATRFGKKPYMRFATQSYWGCRNHAENQVQRYLCDIFEEYQIAFSPRVFQATHQYNHFIKKADTRLERPLVLIDNLGDYPYPNKCDVLEGLKKSLGATEIIQQLPIEQLDPGSNYLVLNHEIKSNGSSVVITEGSKNKAEGEGNSNIKMVNSFWQAWDHVTGKGRVQDLDYYSQLKVQRLKKPETHLPLVLQGCNLGSEKNTTALKSPNTHKTETLANQLWLKEAVFSHGKIYGFKVPDSTYILVSVRKTKPQRGGSEKALIAATRIEFTEGILHIGRPEYFDSEAKAKVHLKALKDSVGKLYNDNFYLIDETREVVICRYNTNRVPAVIGSADRCSMETAKGAGGQISKSIKPDKSVLPYYLARKPKENSLNQYQQLFIQKNGNEALVFCTPKNQIKQTPDKRILTYNFIGRRFDGQEVDVLQEPAAQLLLCTYTLDLLKQKEITQSSLLEKISKMMLEN